ncbi:hypothetical protein [Undibacterium parvum]|uniref:Uncharacterized protein n=1 Tax=Undibacterium parvum TaxID=401471 RepID=A0A3S9HMA0_9BURK|nr:hypothetical protein [Undibacterium parvum]AZP13218.1 hypothetical protein EJN92_15170 [Undibacterium parvum]
MQTQRAPVFAVPPPSTNLQRWRRMKLAKKGVASVVIGYFGVLRPNGAIGLFALSLLLLAVWAGMYLYV